MGWQETIGKRLLACYSWTTQSDPIKMVTCVQLVATLAVLLSTFIGCYGSDLHPTACVGSISSFPNCDKVDQILQRCNSLTVKQEKIDCFCTQQLLNAYVG